MGSSLAQGLWTLCAKISKTSKAAFVDSGPACNLHEDGSDITVSHASGVAHMTIAFIHLKLTAMKY